MKKNKTLKRFLAFLLCAAMVITYMPSSVYTLADDGTDDVVAEETAAEPVQEEAVEEPAPAPEAEAVEEEAPAEEPASVEEAAPAEETEPEATPAEATEPAPAPAEEAVPAEEEPVDDPEVVEATPEEKAQMPANTFKGSAGSVSVTVEAPEGALPEGTKMVVNAIRSADVIDAISNAVEGEVKQVKAVDITFYKDGVEIQPQKEVAVSLSVATMKFADNYSVVHVADNGVASEVSGADVSRTGADFTADSFSVYAVIGTDDGINTDETARRTYKFVLDDGTAYKFNAGDRKVDYQIVKNGDTLVAPTPDPTKEVGANEDGAYVFDGWYNGNTKFTFGSPESGIDEDETILLTAKFKKVYYVQYRDVEYQLKDGRTVQNIMESQEVASGGTATVDDLEAVPLSANKKFSGWATSKDATTAQYHAGDEITNVNSDIDLYPVLADAVWVRFDGKKGSYTGSLQIYKGEKATKPADPTREGYTFVGWCTDEACTAAYDWNTTLTEDQWLYAKWEAANVEYTVAYWQENADDDGYTFVEQEKMTGKTGAQTVATAPANRYEGFHPYGGYSDETSDDYKLTQETITGDGKTVVNVYYNRNDYTVEFHRPNNSSQVISELTITAKYGQTITDLWPSRRTELSRTYPVNWIVRYGGWNQSDTYQSNLSQMPLNGAVFYLHEEDTGYVMTTNYYVQTAAGGDNFVLDHADVFNDDTSRWSTTKEDYYEIKGYKPVFRRTSDAGDIPSGKYVVDSSLSHTSAAVGSSYTRDSGTRYHIDFYYVRDSFNVIFEPNASGAPDAKDATVMFGASLNGIAPTNYVVNETTFTTDGKPYIFKGWYDNALGEGTAFDFNTTMPAESFTLYAKWEEQKFPINVDPNGGELGPNQATWYNVNAGEIVKEYRDISRDYIEASDGTYYYHVDKRPSDPNSDNGRTSFYSTDASQSSDGGKKYKPEEDAYQLIGWFYADGDKAGQAYDFGPATGPANIIAHWKRVGKFTVTIFYKGADGSTQTIPGLNYSDQANAITPTSVPYTPDGQVLTGWEIKKDGQVVKSLGLGEEFKIDAATMATRTSVDGYTEDIIEVDPVFKDSNKLDLTKITFNANGGTGTVAPASNLDLNGNESETNNKVTLPSSGFTKDGYQLIGWSSKSGNNTVEYILGGNYAADGKDNTLYAVWAEKINVTVTGEIVEEVYDGNEKSNAKETANGYTVTAAGQDTTDASNLVDVTIDSSVKAPATGTEVGEYPMGLSNDTVTAALKGETKNIKNAGEVVVVGNKYYILGTKAVTDGKLTITANTEKVTVTITENSGSEKYDGSEKTVKGYKVTSISNPLYTEKDFTFSGNAEVKGTDAGSYPMELKPTDFTNVSKNFTNVEFKIVDGTLEISKRTVTLTSADDEKVYDGKALTNNTVSVGGDGFVSGEGATYNVTGTQTEVGSSANAFTYKLNDGTKAANYEISTKEGTLKVTPVTEKVTVTIKENSGNEKYDGTEKTVTGYTVQSISNPLYTEKDFTFSGDATVKGTDAGSYPMQLKAADFTNNNNNFKEVEFVIVDGTLEIAKRTVTLTSADDEKVYDGKALTNDEVTVGGDGFAKGEGATYDVTGTQTNVGSSANAFTYTLNDGTKAANYDITKTEGTLTVTANTDKVTVTITEHSGEFKYDGSEKTVTGYDVDIDNKLYTTDDFTFSGKAEIKGTDAGSYPMELKASDFTNTSKNFTNVEFKIVDGTLEITKRTVTLTSATDSKVYDGTALTNDEVTVGGDGFAEGEGATYDVTGTQTEVGNSKNTFSYTLNDGTKAGNYTITKTEGTLTVTELTDEVVVTITEHSGSEKYDGKEKTVTGYDVKISNPLYTEADFEFKGNDTVKGTDAGSYPMELKASDFTNKSKNFSNVKFIIVDGTLEISKRSVTLTSADGEKVYDGTPLTKNAQTDVTVGGDGFAEGEGATYDITGTRTEVGETPNAFTYKLNDGTKAANYEISTKEGTLKVTPVTDKVTVTITEHKGSEKYDGTEKTVTGYDVDIDNKLYKESDFTFSGNAEVKGTDAGSYPMELKPADFTNVSKNFTNVEFVIVDGTLEISKRTVTLTSADDTKVYDGTALTNDEVTVGGDGFVKGEGATYDVTGTQTDVGESANAFTYKLNDGTKAANYDITKTEGTLTVTPLTDKVTVTITENSGTEKYDGKEKTVTGYEVTSISNKLYTEKDFTFGGDATVKGTDAGIYQMEIKPADFTNTSKNFTNVEFVIVDGTLEITKREVTLTSATDEKVYDGTALTNDKVTVGGDGFADGEGAKYDVTGTQTDAGSSANAFTYTLNDDTKAGNYTITKTEGTLTVTPVTDKVTVKITGHKEDVYYNGEAQKAEGYDVEIDNKLYTEKDFEFSGTALVEKTDVKRDSENKADTYPMGLKEADFKNISKNFTNVVFEVTDGSLKIKPLKVTIESASAEKTYDGKPLTKHEVTVEGFVEGEGLASINVTGSQTYVGSSDNTFDYKLFTAMRRLMAKIIVPDTDAYDAAANKVTKTTKAENYDITKIEGTLTVTDDDVNIDDVATKTHEGKEYKLGETVVFTIEVTNIYDAVKTITITEQEGVKITSDNVFEGVKPGEKVKATAEYVVTEADLIAGEFNNKATVKFSDVDKPYEPEDKVDTEDPKSHLTVDKKTTSKPANGKKYALGETITYKVTATNDGNMTLKNIEVTDELTGDTWKIDKLAPGKSKSFNAVHKVTEKDIIAGSVVNEATATAEPDDPDAPEPEIVPGKTKDPTEKSNPHLTIVKTVTNEPKDGKRFTEGETITYDIKVLNDGNLTVKNIDVEDELTGDSWTIDSLKPGKSETFSAKYKVTKADAEKGSVTNVATATGETDDPDNPEPTVVPGKSTVPIAGPTPKPTPGHGPDTGDHTGLMGLLGVFGASVVGFFAMLFRRKREQE